MEQVEKVPLVTLEAANERTIRAVKYMALGWVLTAVVLGMTIVMAISYETQAVEEVTTTTTDVDQAADNYGRNYYASGDLVNDSQADGQEDGYEDN